MNLENKIVVITGVSKGIGYALANQLLNKGAIVVGLGINNPGWTHKNAHFIKTNVRNYAEVEASFNKIKKEIGEHIEVLVNNAGLGYFGNLEEISLDQWHEMYETNVDGIFYCCKQVIADMKNRESGHIINISSVAGLEGYPQVSAYCSTKWAVKGLSEALYKECRDHRVKVTCVYPGSVKTDFFRNSPGIKAHDYMLMPDDVAQVIIQQIEMPTNFHTVNLEIRPLQPKGPKK